jgi:molecular chaperone DnaK (HSP70)
MDKTYRPEQVLAMMFTKVKDIVKKDQGEQITTFAVFFLSHFTETKKKSIHDTAKIAGLHQSKYKITPLPWS